MSVCPVLLSTLPKECIRQEKASDLVSFGRTLVKSEEQIQIQGRMHFNNNITFKTTFIKAHGGYFSFESVYVEGKHIPRNCKFFEKYYFPEPDYCYV